jgi:acyl-CoA synthetase (AMP-forming)/AMP-acid ligase II
VNLARLVVYNARRHEQSPAVASPSGVATYRTLMGAVAAAVRAIASLELAPLSLVLLDIRNPVHHIAMIYALALSGIRSASVGTAYVSERAGPLPALFLTDRPKTAPNDIPVRQVSADWFAHDERRPVDYAGLLRMPGFADPDEVFRLMYSSGTTGRPKCVGLTGRTLEARAARSAFEMPYQAKSGPTMSTMGFSTVLGTLIPFMTHTNGGLLCLSSGGGAALQLIRAFGVTYLAGSVAQLQDTVRALRGSPPPPTLRTVFPAGSAIPRPLLVELRARLASHVYGMYNSTEMGRITVFEAEDMARGARAVGYVAPAVTLEIVDGDGRPLPQGQDGAIRVRSPELAVYVSDDGEVVQAFEADGWFYPGDMGRLEADGMLMITGRTSEVMNLGGMMVAPEAVEEVLRLDGRFGDLAVTGVPSPSGIDQVWAAVVSAEPFDEAAVLAAARVRLNERTPSRIVVVDRIPRNENGKVMRNVLRDELVRMTRS